VPEEQSTTAALKPGAGATFEAGLTELEAIVKEMESSELPLERALELFERGMKLSETCRKQLEEAETRVEMLVRRGDKVQPEPFRPDRT
jgi:exodeoxyribonuclease VII small subunit